MKNATTGSNGSGRLKAQAAVPYGYRRRRGAFKLGGLECRPRKHRENVRQQVAGQKSENGYWGRQFVLVSGLLTRLAVRQAKVGLRTVRACRHGFSTRHASVGHRGHVGCLRRGSRTDIARHCPLHKEQVDQQKYCRDQASAAIAGHEISRMRALRRVPAGCFGSSLAGLRTGGIQSPANASAAIKVCRLLHF